jgi:cytochrome c oxidase subunit 3
VSHEATSGFEGVPPEMVGHHFANMNVQAEAMRLGMWLFLATEILLFAGLFCGYAVYRFEFPLAFQESSRHLNLTLGTLNTIVLITSSFTVALGIHYARTDKPKLAGICLIITVLFALAFLGFKAIEYAEHFKEHALPGKYYAFEEVKVPGAAMFYSLYFLMTGLHGVHVLVGMCVLIYITWRCFQGRYSSHYYMGIELGGLYWHLVDLVWIFLYPLLYLI